MTVAMKLKDTCFLGFPGGSVVEEFACQCRGCKGHRFKPWSRKWQFTPVFLLGEFYGQRGLVGYIPCGCKELGMTEHLSMVLCSLEGKL